jgi:hypothetical protein
MIRRNYVPARLLLAAILASGFAVVWGLLGLWVVSAAQSALGLTGVEESLLFLADGSPVVIARGWEMRDLSGKPLPSNVETRWLGTVDFEAVRKITPRSADVSWAERIRIFEDDRRPPVYWYLITDGKAGGSGYLAGYDSTSKSRVGFIGTKGFHVDELPLEEHFPFSGNGDAMQTRVHGTTPRAGQVLLQHGSRARTAMDIPPWCVYIHGDNHTIYQVDLGTRETHVALADPAIRSAQALTNWGPGSATGTASFMIRTSHEVLELSNDNRVMRRFVIPHELQDQDFSFGKTDQGRAIYFTHFLPDDHAREYHYHIFWADRFGNVAQAEKVIVRANDPGLSLGSLLGGILPAPAFASGFVATIRPFHIMELAPANSYAECLKRSLGEYWPALLGSGLIGLLCAVFCYRRQARYAAGGAQRFIWPIFVFLFGIPGWVGYLTCRNWPVVERCPSCGASAPRDRFACAGCHAEFPMPVLRGTEVYAA